MTGLLWAGEAYLWLVVGGLLGAFVRPLLFAPRRRHR